MEYLCYSNCFERTAFGLELRSTVYVIGRSWESGIILVQGHQPTNVSAKSPAFAKSFRSRKTRGEHALHGVFTAERLPTKTIAGRLALSTRLLWNSLSYASKKNDATFPFRKRSFDFSQLNLPVFSEAVKVFWTRRQTVGFLCLFQTSCSYRA